MTETNKHVYAYAEVWSRDGKKPIAWIGGMTQPVPGPSGRLRLPIVLDTRWLALARESGRQFLLRNLRIQDPDTFIPIDQIAELPVTLGKQLKLPKAASLSATEVVKDDSLYLGKGDRTISVPDYEPQLAMATHDDQPRPATASHHNMSTGILLVHGWCSSPVWPVGDFGRPGRIGGTAVFSDPDASRSHDEFALRIRDQGASHFTNAFTVVAHSQGGMAALHLRTFYNSLLDNSTAPRRIQSVGTPYGGSTLMDYYLGTSVFGWLIAEIFGWCHAQWQLGTLGSATWLSAIPDRARYEVFYYRTGYERPNDFSFKFWKWRCNAASFVIPRWDDGVVAYVQGRLSGGRDMGSSQGECHTQGMKHPPQTHSPSRNDMMDSAGRPAPPPDTSTPRAAFTWTPTCGETSVSFDASGSYDPNGSIVSYEWQYDMHALSPPVTNTHPWGWYLYDRGYGPYSVTLCVTDDAGVMGCLTDESVTAYSYCP